MKHNLRYYLHTCWSLSGAEANPVCVRCDSLGHIISACSLKIWRRQPAASHPLFFSTQSGQDMYKLQLVDELARRVASYASEEPPVGTAKHAKEGWNKIRNHVKRGPRHGLLRAVTMGSSLSDILDHRAGASAAHSRASSVERPVRNTSLQKLLGSLPARRVNSHPGTLDIAVPESVTHDHMSASPVGDLESGRAGVESDGEGERDEEDDEWALKQWILELASYGRGKYSRVEDRIKCMAYAQDCRRFLSRKEKGRGEICWQG